MPAYYTHFVYGIQAYKKTKMSVLKDIIRKHKHAYTFGLAGPDFFLFSLSDTIKYKRNIGSIMHEKRTGRFLRNLYAEVMWRKDEEREIGLAYFAGFLGHYALDCNCHPLIYQLSHRKSKYESLGVHFEFEAAMDVFVESLRGKAYVVPSVFRAVKLNPIESRVICDMLFSSLRRTYPERKITGLFVERSIARYSRMLKCLMDPSCKKEQVVRRMEYMLLGYPCISALFLNGNTYGYTKQEWKIFYRELQAGYEELQKMLRELDHTLASGKSVKRLFHLIGNRSYHTGL